MVARGIADLAIAIADLLQRAGGGIEVALERQRHDRLDERGAVEGIEPDQRIAVKLAVRAFAERAELVGHAEEERADGFDAASQ